MKDKIVYVLGAGFSKEANAPSQEELVSKIFEVYKDDPTIFRKSQISRFTKVLRETYNIPRKLQVTMPLEDIFTPLDRCLLDNISFRNLSINDIKIFRSLVFELIGKTLDVLLKNSEKNYIDDFAEYLVQLALVRTGGRYKDFDPVAVISTNWDILLDNSIHEEIKNHSPLGVVDYCCYVSSNEKTDELVKPGLEILGLGGFNVKLLKLHGSLNWLQCPRCQRLYAEFNTKIGLRQFNQSDKPVCRHCNKNFGIQRSSHNLISNLIMPTFLKDLSNPQYKIIWQNAGIELSEAKKIVFIGYSLPSSDFEMRQLLSRMVNSDTEIEVVDFKSARDNGASFNLVMGRYKQFFGKKVKAYQYGTKRYILDEISPLIVKRTIA